MNRRKTRLQAEIGTFVRQYSRKAYPGIDPNDRAYSRKTEQVVKQLKVEELDELLNGDGGEEDPAPASDALNPAAPKRQHVRASRDSDQPTEPATILRVRSWKKDFVGFTGYDSYAKSELKKRLRRAIAASPKELRHLNSAILSRECVVLLNVRERYVESLRQILGTLGARVVYEPNKRVQATARKAPRLTPSR